MKTVAMQKKPPKPPIYLSELLQSGRKTETMKHFIYIPEKYLWQESKRFHLLYAVGVWKKEYVTPYNKEEQERQEEEEDAVSAFTGRGSSTHR